jgi:hypothetical protein
MMDNPKDAPLYNFIQAALALRQVAGEYPTLYNIGEGRGGLANWLTMTLREFDDAAKQLFDSENK